MKKLYLILCAGILAFVAASCGKDVPPAKPMTAPEVKQKLADTAVDALKEVDPNLWKDWGQSGLKLVNALRKVEEGNLDDLGDDLEAVMRSIVSDDKKTTVTLLLKLSQFKGDITVVDDAFQYTKSNNPLNLTYVFEGKTYKAQLESSGESGNGILLREREYVEFGEANPEVRIIKLVVPAKAAIHVTENGKLFLDAVINPVIEDKNKNGILDDTDAIKGTATIQIPDYSLALNSLSISDEGVTAALDLSHGSKKVLSVEADMEMDLFIERVKAAMDEVTVNTLPDDITGTVSILGGAALLKADIDMGDLQNAETHYATEAEARKVAAVFTKNAKADLYFDNNPTIQASLCFMVEENEYEGWSIVPGVHLYDGSADIPVFEFFDLTEDVWKPVTGEFTSLITKISKYFGDLLPKK